MDSERFTNYREIVEILMLPKRQKDGKLTRILVNQNNYIRLSDMIPTRKEALTALAEFNANPYDVNAAKITFEDVYERWSDEHFPTVSDSNVKGYRAAWALCSKIARMRFADVKLDHLQMVVDESGKNYPTLRKLKILFSMMYKYAVIHEIVPKERNLVEYLDIKKAGNPNAYNREPFSKAEVKKIWNVKDSNIYYTVILMLIYTGCRIGELLDLKKDDVNLDERYFKIIASKTAAGMMLNCRKGLSVL